VVYIVKSHNQSRVEAFGLGFLDFAHQVFTSLRSLMKFPLKTINSTDSKNSVTFHLITFFDVKVISAFFNTNFLNFLKINFKI